MGSEMCIRDSGETEGGAHGKEERSSDQKGVAWSMATDNPFDPGPQGSPASHGKGGLRECGGFGNIAEGGSIVIRISSDGNYPGVAGEFTLSHELGPKPPDERIEPVDEAGTLGD